MKISRLTREQREYFLDMDPLMKMDWLDFPNTFALAATTQQNGSDIPLGLMICSTQAHRLVIDWLCVSAAHRMKGIGEQLLLEAFTIAKNAGFGVVAAYIDEAYGRRQICGNQEQYFKERSFGSEHPLGGEWIMDLRTLAAQPFFHQKKNHQTTGHIPQVLPLRRMSVTMIRDAVLDLQARPHTATLYDMDGLADHFDPDLSFFLLDEGVLSGGFLVQCIGRDAVTMTESSLYPVLLHAGTEQNIRALLFASLQAAAAKYDMDTDVHVVLTDRFYERACIHILPDRRIGNKLLISNRFDLNLERTYLP